MPKIYHLYRFSLLLCLLAFSHFTHALNASNNNKTDNSNIVSVQEAWVRPSHPGQEVGAAYMTFLSTSDVTLTKIESSATQNVEIHNMSMENGVMKMRMLDNLHLKANTPYKLAPGGYHLMLFDLKKPLIAGKEVSFTLTFKKNKTTFKKIINVMVQEQAE